MKTRKYLFLSLLLAASSLSGAKASTTTLANHINEKEPIFLISESAGQLGAINNFYVNNTDQETEQPSNIEKDNKAQQIDKEQKIIEENKPSLIIYRLIDYIKNLLRRKSG